MVLLSFGFTNNYAIDFLYRRIRTVEDFREWTNWLLYRGGIGVQGKESWEAWWDEELVCSLFCESIELSLYPCAVASTTIYISVPWCCYIYFIMS